MFFKSINMLYYKLILDLQKTSKSLSHILASDNTFARTVDFVPHLYQVDFHEGGIIRTTHHSNAKTLKHAL